jgi:SAM-dependent methyltransferase
MAITRQLAELIFREHAYKPVGGRVLTIGRLAVHLSPDEAISLARQCNVGAAIGASDLSLDMQTEGAEGTNINDHSFFRLLGINRIEALDVSGYEGATIIHDLTQTLPPSLVEAFDFVCDGGTMDNVFDPACAIRNLAAMTRPGGRLVSVNMASNHLTPYVIFNPMWFHDYFVVNGFADCQVYICLLEDQNRWNSFAIDAEHLATNPRAVYNIQSPYMSFALVLAEKGPQSTSDRMPIQLHYRGDDQRHEYQLKLAPLLGSGRGDLVWSTCGRLIDSVPEGYRAIQQEEVALPQAS